MPKNNGLGTYRALFKYCYCRGIYVKFHWGTSFDVHDHWRRHGLLIKCSPFEMFFLQHVGSLNPNLSSKTKPHLFRMDASWFGTLGWHLPSIVWIMIQLFWARQVVVVFIEAEITYESIWIISYLFPRCSCISGAFGLGYHQQSTR